MEYYDHLRMFLNLEQRLASIMEDLPYEESRGNTNTESIRTETISLLLLSTCPVIESYMVHLSSRSQSVQDHPLWNWEYAHTLWKTTSAKTVPPRLKTPRQVQNSFPKSAAVVQEVFGISEKTLEFHRHSPIKYVHNDPTAVIRLQPFQRLSDYPSYLQYAGERSGFPNKTAAPDWWTAYNKAKHDMSEAKLQVNCRAAVHALGGLFSLLAYSEPDKRILSENHFLSVHGNVMESKVFRATAPH